MASRKQGQGEIPSKTRTGLSNSQQGRHHSLDNLTAHTRGLSMQNTPAPSFTSSSPHTHPTPYPQGPYPYGSSNETRQHYEHNMAAPVKPAPANPQMPQHPQHGPPAFGDSSPSDLVWYPPGEESTPIPRPTRTFLPGEPLPPTVVGSLAWHYNMTESMPFSAFQQKFRGTHDAEKLPTHDHVHASGAPAPTIRPTANHAPGGPAPSTFGSSIDFHAARGSNVASVARQHDPHNIHNASESAPADYSQIHPELFGSRCARCKALHSSCDQRRPICGRCSKSGDECSYPVIFRSCTHCHEFKLKCDHGKPNCGMCSKYGSECKYPERIPESGSGVMGMMNLRRQPSGPVPHDVIGYIEEIEQGLRRTRWIHRDRDQYHPEYLGWWNVSGRTKERRVQVSRVRPGDLHHINGVVPEQVIGVDDRGNWAYPLVLEGEVCKARDMRFPAPGPSRKQDENPHGRDRYKKQLPKP